MPKSIVACGEGVHVSCANTPTLRSLRLPSTAYGSCLVTVPGLPGRFRRSEKFGTSRSRGWPPDTSAHSPPTLNVWRVTTNVYLDAALTRSSFRTPDRSGDGPLV